MATQNSLIGQTIGQYKILSELGRGGMGTVYLAHQESLDRQVALKILATHLVEDETFVKRFVQEGRTAAALIHPNIVTIHEIGQEGGNFFIAMEAVRGKSISALLEKSGKLPLRNALEITRQAAKALTSAHDKGVIHRDIKPENIMLNEQGRVKLMDFGIAKAIDGAGSLTATGALLGTPKYMSPEQCKSGALGPPSDIYSLGVVLYEMLCGQLPYESDTPLSLMIKIAQDPFPRLPGVNVSIPASVERVVRNMTAREQENRYASGRALVKDLEICLRDPKAPIRSTWTSGEDVDASKDVGPGQNFVADLMDEAPSATESAVGWAPDRPKKAVALRMPPLRTVGIAAAVLALVVVAIFIIPILGSVLSGFGSGLSGRSTLDGVGPGEVINNGTSFELNTVHTHYIDVSSGNPVTAVTTELVEFDGETYLKQEQFVRGAEDAAAVDFAYWIHREGGTSWYWNLGDAHPRQTFRYPVREGQEWTDTFYLSRVWAENDESNKVHIRVTAENSTDYPPGTTRYDVSVDSESPNGKPDYENASVKYWWSPHVGVIKGRTDYQGNVNTWWLSGYSYRGRSVDMKVLYETGDLTLE